MKILNRIKSAIVPGGERGATSKRAALIVGACAAVIAFLLYLPALQNQFVIWDDDLNVYENTHIRSLDSQFILWAFTDMESGNWQPLTWISHAVDYQIWRLNPAGYHLTSITLHSINVFLVVLLSVALLDLHRTGLQRPMTSATENIRDNSATLIAGGVTGLLFGCHPAHVESVSWISGRTDLLCTMFFFMSLLAYFEYARRSADADPAIAGIFRLNRWYVWSFALFSLAAFSKPMAITFPAVLLLADWYPLGRMKTRKELISAFLEKGPFIALSVAVALLTLHAETTLGAVTGFDNIALTTRLLVAAKSLVSYVTKLIWPHHLVPLYPYPADSALLSFEYLGAIMLSGCATMVSILLVKKQKLFLFSWTFYIITLLPVLGIIKARPVFMADRYSYLPTVGLLLIAGVSAASLWRAARRTDSKLLKSSVAALGILLLSYLCHLTTVQNSHWKDSLALWNYVIDSEGVHTATAYNNRGSYYGEQGDYDRAIRDFSMAIALSPTDASAYRNLAVAFENKGQFENALKYYNIVLMMNSEDHFTYYNRGITYKKIGKLNQALEDYTKALALKPGFLPARLERAGVYAGTGQIDRAMMDYRDACALGSEEACRMFALSPTRY